MSRRSGLEYNPIWKKDNLMAEMQSGVQFDQSGSLSFMQFSLQWRFANLGIYLFPDPKLQKCSTLSGRWWTRSTYQVWSDWSDWSLMVSL